MSQLPDPPLRLLQPALSFWRGTGRLQVELPGQYLLLEGVPTQLGEAIGLLAQPRTKAELSAQLPGLEPSWIDWVCAHLSRAGLLTAVAPERSVVVVGRGALAARVVVALTEAGISVHRRHPEDCTDGSTQDLVILADGRIQPDRALLARLIEARAVHLVVRTEPSRAVVGPLVVPGTTPCVRCDDVSHCQLDAHWPLVLAQLCGTTVAADPCLVAWAAATAAVQAHAWASGAEPETLGRCLELGLGDFRLRSRSWPLQPECTCTAAGGLLHAGLPA